MALIEVHIPEKARNIILFAGLTFLGGGAVAGGAVYGGLLEGDGDSGQPGVTRGLPAETPTVVPTATSTPEPTPTETPTPEPIPTETPVPPTATRQPQIIVTPRPTSSPPPEPTKAVEISGSLNVEATRSLAGRINQTRAENGVSPLRVESRLQRAAELYIMYIYNYHWVADKRNLDPHTLNGTVGTRAAEQGYRVGAGEVFGWAVVMSSGQWDAKILEGWMNSPGHRANVLRPSFVDMGVGCASVVDYYIPYYRDPVPMLICVVDFGIPGN